MEDVKSTKLSDLIFIQVLGSGKIEVSCNACSNGDYLWFEGEDTATGDTDWLGQAIAHGMKYHKSYLTKA